MRELIKPESTKAAAAPVDVREKAREGRLQILHIVWDADGGYPEHSWGYEQWSLRPYVQGYGCDGTTDENVHLIAWRMCEQVGLDYFALYEEAYSDHEKPGECWLRTYFWTRTIRETIIPQEVSERTLRGVLHDLNEINNRSIRAVLEDEFTRLGFDVSEWWNFREVAA